MCYLTWLLNKENNLENIKILDLVVHQCDILKRGDDVYKLCLCEFIIDNAEYHSPNHRGTEEITKNIMNEFTADNNVSDFAKCLCSRNKLYVNDTKEILYKMYYKSVHSFQLSLLSANETTRTIKWDTESVYVCANQFSANIIRSPNYLVEEKTPMDAFVNKYKCKSLKEDNHILLPLFILDCMIPNYTAEIMTSQCEAGTYTYAKNEINLDVFENVNVIINQQNKFLSSYCKGKMAMVSSLSNMPICGVHVNDKVMIVYNLQYNNDMFNNMNTYNSLTQIQSFNNDDVYRINSQPSPSQYNNHMKLQHINMNCLDRSMTSTNPAQQLQLHNIGLLSGYAHPEQSVHEFNDDQYAMKLQQEQLYQMNKKEIHLLIQVLLVIQITF